MIYKTPPISCLWIIRQSKKYHIYVKIFNAADKLVETVWINIWMVYPAWLDHDSAVLVAVWMQSDFLTYTGENRGTGIWYINVNIKLRLTGVFWLDSSKYILTNYWWHILYKYWTI